VANSHIGFASFWWANLAPRGNICKA